MKTHNECLALFAKETLFAVISCVRTTAIRFIIIAENIATGDKSIFYVNARLQTITKQ